MGHGFALVQHLTQEVLGWVVRRLLIHLHWELVVLRVVVEVLLRHCHLLQLLHGFQGHVLTRVKDVVVLMYDLEIWSLLGLSLLLNQGLDVGLGEVLFLLPGRIRIDDVLLVVLEVVLLHVLLVGRQLEAVLLRQLVCRALLRNHLLVPMLRKLCVLVVELLVRVIAHELIVVPGLFVGRFDQVIG